MEPRFAGFYAEKRKTKRNTSKTASNRLVSEKHVQEEATNARSRLSTQRPLRLMLFGEGFSLRPPENHGKLRLTKQSTFSTPWKSRRQPKKP
ncbi:hypothetical protein HPB52_015681 [Rhipicephalus sanguineus]|uniref:Uncharacterized protein n=1 Tax=Rhipicephalus sanguineus TaxID=34632 RepID=A0A9D4PM24_RHISA|nr:hypothetical protein HPB52_015681 [Rhipicephalus sanguineus]